MKITNVYTEEYRWPKDKPIRNGKHVFTHGSLNLVVIETDEGITGYGSSYSLEFVDYLKQFLIGEDPLCTEALWEKMWVPKNLGRRSVSTRSISAIDIALWDIRAKAAGMPLYKLLGGYTNKIPCYIAGGYYGEGKGLKELQQEMEEYLSWNVKAIKMKIGGASADEDYERVKAVREVIGDKVRLMLDANCAYTYYDAIKIAHRLEEFDPFWFEEPVMPDDYDGMKKIAQHTIIPIATGENEYTRYGFRDLINTQAVGIINPDCTVIGGVTEYAKIVAYAQANGIGISPHGIQQLHVHLDCAFQGVVQMEFYPPSYDSKIYDMFINPSRISSDGTISPSEDPGIGMDPNREMLNRYRVK